MCIRDSPNWLFFLMLNLWVSLIKQIKVITAVCFLIILLYNYYCCRCLLVYTASLLATFIARSFKHLIICQGGNFLLSFFFSFLFFFTSFSFHLFLINQLFAYGFSPYRKLGTNFSFSKFSHLWEAVFSSTFLNILGTAIYKHCKYLHK